MRRCAIGFVFVAWCIGCQSRIVRQEVVSPMEAVAYGARAKVVAVTRHGNVQPVSRGVIRDGRPRVVTAADTTLTVANEDRLTIEVAYDAGDEIPGEGVVQSHPSVATILIGSAAILAGGIVMVIGACSPGDVCPTRHSYGCTNTCFDVDFDKAETEFFILLAGGGIALGGIITTIIGAIPKNGIVKTDRVHITPVATKGGAGAALQIRF